ncbi:MAG: zinc-dependent peptidase, partial [Bacteroidota bacterium]|nr:zinc-dependent peptidase [Bacteroidota bacterium]MDX5430562.1 zinc-dependent peptidase [Bacteroidota bacterium]MDX5469314.1 zinc-dependent peptidase [Bacteroidota bacterium]
MQYEPNMFIISCFAFGLSLLLVFFGLPYLEAEWSNYYFNKIKWKNEITRKQFLHLNQFFESRFSYYRRLSPDGKAKFIYRTLEFRQDLDFEGREGLEVTEHMRLLICGAAAQITYGLTYFHLPHFKRILVYPDTFYSKLLDADVKGLTYGAGHISISWRDFEEGFRISNDGYNLGLHELAHAMEINQRKGSDSDKLNQLYLENFIDVSFAEFQRLNQEYTELLDARAKRNQHEFFSVCVEHFFEAPEKFREKLPNVFHHLCLVLQQNPLNIHGDYLLEESYFSEARRKANRPIPHPIR